MRGLGVAIVSTFDGSGIEKAKREFAQLETTSQKAGFLLKKAFLPATAAAGALATAGFQAGQALLGMAQAAAEDQKEQVLLANTLKNVTNATSSQIALAEDQIDLMQRASGVADSQLRPALSNLVRYTKDVGEAQKLLNLSLDIAAARNISVEQASMALGKAYSGNFNALKKLGVPMSGAIANAKAYNDALKKQTKAQQEVERVQQSIAMGYISGKDAANQLQDAQEKLAKSVALVTAAGRENVDWQQELQNTFGGASAQAANTFEGRMARLTIRFDEFKESIGAALLPLLEDMAEIAIKLADAFAEGGLGGALKKLQEVAPGLYNFFRITYNIFAAVGDAAYNITNAVKLMWRALSNPFNIKMPEFGYWMPTWADLLASRAGMGSRGGDANAQIVNGRAGAAGPLGGTGAPVGAGPAGVTSQSFGGRQVAGQQINVTVTSADPRAVVDALVKYNRQNGAVPITVGR